MNRSTTASTGAFLSSAASREDHIEVSASGLVSVVGGKLTTARITATRALDRVIERIGNRPEWGGTILRKATFDLDQSGSLSGSVTVSGCSVMAPIGVRSAEFKTTRRPFSAV